MRLIFIRHAEPDYEHNCITENGIIEANSLAKRLLKEKIDHIYISPLNRAYLTAKPYLDISKKEFTTLDYLKEFDAKVIREDGYTYAWDYYLNELEDNKEIYDYSTFKDSKLFDNTNFKEKYDEVTSKFDKLLEKHGYKRNNDHYDVIKGNKDTIVFFCHLGVEFILLSHLFNIPSVMLAQHMCVLPSSVTILYTEERKEKIVQFRATRIGDLSHLYNDNIKESFMARFQENYEDNGRK